MIFTLLSQPQLLLIWLVGIVYAITVHEFSHALAATQLGDRTARDQGRLTLNPMKHLDMVGFIVLLLAGFGWGRPVPFNPYNLRNQRWGPVLISLAGPASNLLSFLVFGFALKLVLGNGILEPTNLLAQFMFLLLEINFVLAVFNLLPVPPLDGSKLLYALLPSRFQHVIEPLERYGSFVLLGLVILGGSLIGGMFNALYQFALRIFG
ncbi:MAG: site-2 protease family protein [Patescibacteria group bacterium]